MTTNVETFSISAAKYAFWAVKNSTGVYPYGATGTIANGSDSSMQRHRAVASLALSIPNGSSSPIQGDGGILGSFRAAPTDPITGTLVFNTLDLNFDIACDGRSIYADGEFDAVMMDHGCIDYNKLCMVFNFEAQNPTTGEEGWGVLEVWDIEAQPQGVTSLSGTSYDVQAINYPITVDAVSTEPTGVAVSSSNYGVSKSPVKYYWSVNPVAFHTHVGDAADTTLTLGYTPAASDGDKVQLWQDGTAKTYTTHYTVSSTTFTFVAAPGAGVVSVIRYQFQADC